MAPCGDLNTRIYGYLNLNGYLWLFIVYGFLWLSMASYCIHGYLNTDCSIFRETGRVSCPKKPSYYG